MNHPRPFFVRVASILSARRLPIWLAAFAVLLVTPALGLGFVVDDYVIRSVEIGATRSTQMTPLEVFRFTDGSDIGELIDRGALPWWTSPDLKLAFFRPLAAASHWLDFHLFPDSPPAMHAVSLVWLAATVLVAAALYRRLLGAGWIGGLAALLFAVDPGHAIAAGWISARNAILAAFFGLLSVYAHDRWRRDGERWAAYVAPLACAASLASGESGLATLGLLFAHAVVFEGPSLASRVRALAPAAAVGFVWVVIYRVHGCGAAHSAMYADPMASPSEYLRAAAISIPMNLGARLGGPEATFAPLLARRVLPLVAVVSTAFIVLAALALGPLLRKAKAGETDGILGPSEASAARFFAISAVLAVLPIAGTLPNDRNLFFVGFAALGLVALIVARAADRKSLPLRIFAGWLLLFRLLLSIPSSPVNAVSLGLFAKLSRDPLSRVLLDDAVRTQTVVFVNPPAQFFVSHLSAMRMGTEVPRPAGVRTLWPGIYGAHVARPRADQLAVHVDGGILPEPGTWPAKDGKAPAGKIEYLGQQLGSFVRGAGEAVKAGDVRSLHGWTVEVNAATPEGGPTDITFTFDRPLDDPSLRFLAWRDGEYAPFALPRIGETVDLPPASMAQ